MIRLFANANYDFIKWRRWAYALTAAVIVPGLILLAVQGPQLQHRVHRRHADPDRDGSVPCRRRNCAPSSMRRASTGAEIQSFGSDTSYVIRARLGEHVTTAGGDAEATTAAVQRVAGCEPRCGDLPGRAPRSGRPQGRQGAAGQGVPRDSLFVRRDADLPRHPVRVALRPRRRAGDGHDILTTIAFIRYLNLEVSLVVVGAVLTMVGYSLNDTIIIFDRVRENLRKFRRQNLVRDSEPLDQRDAAALDPDARDDDGGDPRAGHLRRAR